MANQKRDPQRNRPWPFRQLVKEPGSHRGMISKLQKIGIPQQTWSCQNATEVPSSQPPASSPYLTLCLQSQCLTAWQHMHTDTYYHRDTQTDKLSVYQMAIECNMRNKLQGLCRAISFSFTDSTQEQQWRYWGLMRPDLFQCYVLNMYDGNYLIVINS